MSIHLEKVKEPLDIPEALKSILGGGENEAYRFFDDSVYDEGKGYNTFKLIRGEKAFVLKRYEAEEDRDAEVKHYSLLKGLPVPKLVCAAEGCILMEYVEGDDLKSPTDDGIRAAAESLVSIMNAYPMGFVYEKTRYERYLKRLEKRAGCLENEPELKKAFGVFIKRQNEIPLTLSNGDLLPINVLYDGRKATVIDWEFGGFMPYALDIARFIAHCTEDGSVTGFKMSREQKRLFIDNVYEGLELKPERAVFDRDILLALFNECVEILEYYLNDKTAERGNVFGMYYPMAHRLAALILNAR